MEFNGIMGGLYRISEWIMRLSVINILWVVCSIPFFYLVLVALTVPEGGAQMLPLMGILAPFTLFPATAAMFTVARKWVSGDADVPLLKTFFRGYKENYLQAMLGGLLYLVFAIIIYTNYKFYLGQTGSLRLLSILFLLFTILLAGSLFNFFSIMAHLHMKFFQLIKNSLLMTIGQPINTVVILILNLTILYVSFFKFTFLIPFFMGSLIAVVSFFMFYRSFNFLQMKQQQLAEAEAEKAAQENEGTEELPEGTRNEDSGNRADK